MNQDDFRSLGAYEGEQKLKSIIAADVRAALSEGNAGIQHWDLGGNSNGELFENAAQVAKLLGLREDQIITRANPEHYRDGGNTHYYAVKIGESELDVRSYIETLAASRDAGGVLCCRVNGSIPDSPDFVKQYRAHIDSLPAFDAAPAIESQAATVAARLEEIHTQERQEAELHKLRSQTAQQIVKLPYNDANKNRVAALMPEGVSVGSWRGLRLQLTTSEGTPLDPYDALKALPPERLAALNAEVNAPAKRSFP